MMKSRIEQSWFRAASPRSDGGAAIAIIELRGTEALSAELALPLLAVGEIKRCRLLAIDDGMAARVSENLWLLMPHGGPLIMRQIAAKLIESGIAEHHGIACETYPESADEIEALMLSALATARSPRAVELLLKQPALWRVSGARSEVSRDSILCRLLTPPRIVAIGGANIGKSSLANALARKNVAIVADIPGTTRDHVGVWLDLDGLVVQWIDTPGLRETSDELEIASRSHALALLEKADLVLLCGDCTQAPPALPSRVPADRTRVVQLRADMGAVTWNSNWQVSIRNSSGLNGLAQGIREMLVPQAQIDRALPWTFWGQNATLS